MMGLAMGHDSKLKRFWGHVKENAVSVDKILVGKFGLTENQLKEMVGTGGKDRKGTVEVVEQKAKPTKGQIFQKKDLP